MEIRSARPHEVATFFADEPMQWVGAFRDGQPVAMGCFYLEAGRRWAALAIRGPVHRVAVVREILRTLHSLNETVWVSCDDVQFPGAPRLLKFLGFEPTDEIRNNLKVWKWPNWQC